jgi:hypothetical protein
MCTYNTCVVIVPNIHRRPIQHIWSALCCKILNIERKILRSKSAAENGDKHSSMRRAIVSISRQKSLLFPRHRLESQPKFLIHREGWLLCAALFSARINTTHCMAGCNCRAARCSSTFKCQLKASEEPLLGTQVSTIIRMHTWYMFVRLPALFVQNVTHSSCMTTCHCFHNI